MKDQKEKDKSYFYYAGLGVDLVVSTIVGGIIGYFLDGWLGTKPWFMLIFLIFGAASGFLTIYRTLERMDKKK
jgi:ATP synthase protein I